MHVTEDKAYWCQAYGTDVERPFAESLRHYGLRGALNPAKEADPYTHDLIVTFPSDLKTVRTPLFKAKQLYGIDPQYAVTFNRKDMRRYIERYPNIIVIFDVKWESCEATIGGQRYKVDDMHRIHAGFLSEIQQAILLDGSHLHTYQRRVDDEEGNAKQSWVFDVRKLHRIDRGVAQ